MQGCMPIHPSIDRIGDTVVPFLWFLAFYVDAIKNELHIFSWDLKKYKGHRFINTRNKINKCNRNNGKVPNDDT
jgi:hypothetical protein